LLFLEDDCHLGCCAVQSGSSLTDVSEVHAVSIIIIALTMEATSASETLVKFCQSTRRNNPEDSHLHTRRREKLKSYLVIFKLF
jgi:hypothetical protein